MNRQPMVRTDLRAALDSGANVRARAALFVGLVNLLISLVIGTAYLAHLRNPATPRIWLFAHLGMFTSLVTLVLVPAGFLWLAARSRISTRVLVLSQCTVWMVFQVCLYIDTRVYGLFRYHLNGAAWNLLTTRGSQDSYHLGLRIWIIGIALGGLLFAAEYGAWRLALEFEARRIRLFGHGRLRPACIAVTLFALPICVEKTIYAQADLDLDREVATISQMFPVYPRLSVAPLLRAEPRSALELAPEVALRFEGARLTYPLETPHAKASGPRPNILILVIDSWRRDMLAPDVAPELSRFAERARRFDDHLSGGNGTRFGLFSLLYGLHGSYWWPVLEARRAPVLIETLADAGYDLRVFSSASMEFPELRSTAWSGIASCVEDDFHSPRRCERDAELVERFVEWSREAGAGGEPWFSFVLLDSAHQTYDFPAEEAPFQPCAPELDYLEMSGSDDPALALRVKNRYRNAVHYADRMAGRVLAELAAQGQLEHTLVIVTGDHGEEFAEHGHWGHTSNFTREQAAVPFLLFGPGVAPGRESRPTSHLDVACTLLELLGADPASRRGWTLGENLLEPCEQRSRVVAGWEELGVCTPAGIFRVPYERGDGLEISAWGEDWELLSDQRAAFEKESPALDELSRECARFLDPRGVLLARDAIRD